MQTRVAVSSTLEPSPLQHVLQRLPCAGLHVSVLLSLLPSPPASAGHGTIPADTTPHRPPHLGAIGLGRPWCGYELAASSGLILGRAPSLGAPAPEGGTELRGNWSASLGELAFAISLCLSPRTASFIKSGDSRVGGSPPASEAAARRHESQGPGRHQGGWCLPDRPPCAVPMRDAPW